jgi:hypothetical protein
MEINAVSAKIQAFQTSFKLHAVNYWDIGQQIRFVALFRTMEILSIVTNVSRLHKTALQTGTSMPVWVWAPATLKVPIRLVVVVPIGMNLVLRFLPLPIPISALQRIQHGWTACKTHFSGLRKVAPLPIPIHMMT